MKTTESFLLNQLQMIQLHDIEQLRTPSKKERRENMAENLSTREEINQFCSLSQVFIAVSDISDKQTPVHAFNPIYFVFEKHLSSRNQISEGREKENTASARNGKLFYSNCRVTWPEMGCVVKWWSVRKKLSVLYDNCDFSSVTWHWEGSDRFPITIHILDLMTIE